MKSYWPLWMVRCAWISLAIAAWTCREQLILIAADSLPASLPIRLLLYCAVYVALAGIAVPGAVLLTALAGPLFGVGCGTLVASCCQFALKQYQ